MGLKKKWTLVVVVDLPALNPPITTMSFKTFFYSGTVLQAGDSFFLTAFALLPTGSWNGVTVSTASMPLLCSLKLGFFHLYNEDN